MAKYGTVEWANDVKKLLEADKDYVRIMKGCDFKRLTIVSDRPEIKPLIEVLKDGIPVEIRTGEANEKNDFSCAAKMETYHDLLTGKLGAQEASIRGLTQVDGNIAIMMKYMKGFMRATALQKNMNVDW